MAARHRAPLPSSRLTSIASSRSTIAKGIMRETRSGRLSLSVSAACPRLGKCCPPGWGRVCRYPPAFRRSRRAAGGPQGSRRCQMPIQIGETSVSIDASIGISLYPEHATDSTTLMRYADQAMYVAKARGDGAVVHSAAGKRNGGLRSLASDQRDAIKSGQMRLWYQPIVDWRWDNTTRVEALVRWQHPTLGILESADFLPAPSSSEQSMPRLSGSWSRYSGRLATGAGQA